MLKIERRAWIEESGPRVILMRLPGADITLTFWNWRVNVGAYVHDGVPAPRRLQTELGEYDVIFRRTDEPSEPLIEAGTVAL
jgi:hypothetical protein